MLTSARRCLLRAQILASRVTNEDEGALLLSSHTRLDKSDERETRQIAADAIAISADNSAA